MSKFQRSTFISNARKSHNSTVKIPNNVHGINKNYVTTFNNCNLNINNNTTDAQTNFSALEEFVNWFIAETDNFAEKFKRQCQFSSEQEQKIIAHKPQMEYRQNVCALENAVARLETQLSINADDLMDLQKFLNCLESKPESDVDALQLRNCYDERRQMYKFLAWLPYELYNIEQQLRELNELKPIFDETAKQKKVILNILNSHIWFLENAERKIVWLQEKLQLATLQISSILSRIQWPSKWRC